MSAAAEQPTLDLGDYRGRNIVAVKTKLANTNDGFDPNTGGIEGRIYEIGEEITVAVRVVVSAHNPRMVGEDGEIELGQTFKAITMAVVPDKSVAASLNKVEAAQKAAAAEKEKAKAKRKPIKRGQLSAVPTDGPKAVGESLTEMLDK